MTSIWNNKEALEHLEVVRDNLHNQGKRLTFDCLKLRCNGDRAKCSRGRKLGQARDGSIALIIVLRGITSGVCKDCPDFDTEEE